MRFTLAAVVLASSALAAPSSNLEKRGAYNVVVDTVYTTVYNQPAKAANVVYKTVYVTAGAQPTQGYHHGHHHGKPHHGKPKPQHTSTPCTTSTPGYKVITETYVYGGGSKSAAQPTYSAAPAYSSPAAAPVGGGYSGGNAQYQAILDRHNQYRALHGAEPLTWDDNLVNDANNGAYHCLFKHQSGNSNGENLAEGYSSVTAAVDAWYDEYKEYSYNNPGFSEQCGHFTQVVWKNSKTLGCSIQSCGSGTLLRCEYYPPGNYQGEFPANVAPGSGGGY